MFVRVYGCENLKKNDKYIINQNIVCKKAYKYDNISQNSNKKCGYIFNEYFNDKYIKNTDLIIKQKAIHSVNELLENSESKSKPKVDTLFILLHGWGVDSSMYENISMFLSNFGLVVAPDFCGFGKSEDLDRAYTLNDYAIGVIKLVELFDYKKLIFVGHSFGARVIFSSINGVVHGGENISLSPDKIILTGAAGCKPRFSLKKYLKIKRYKYLKKKCKNNINIIKKLQKYGSNDYKNIKNEQLRQTFLNVVNFHQDEFLHKIKCRVLLLFGKLDKETPLYMGRRMNKKIKNSTLKVISGAGHFAFLDNYPYFIKCVQNFLDES